MFFTYLTLHPEEKNKEEEKGFNIFHFLILFLKIYNRFSKDTQIAMANEYGS